MRQSAAVTIILLACLCAPAAVKAQCTYVDPQRSLSGYFTWCRCMGGTPYNDTRGVGCDRPGVTPPPPDTYNLDSARKSFRDASLQARAAFQWRLEAWTQQGGVPAGIDDLQRLLAGFPAETPLPTFAAIASAEADLEGYLRGWEQAYTQYTAAAGRVRARHERNLGLAADYEDQAADLARRMPARDAEVARARTAALAAAAHYTEVLSALDQVAQEARDTARRALERFDRQVPDDLCVPIESFQLDSGLKALASPAYPLADWMRPGEDLSRFLGAVRAVPVTAAPPADRQALLTRLAEVSNLVTSVKTAHSAYYESGGVAAIVSREQESRRRLQTAWERFRDLDARTSRADQEVGWWGRVTDEWPVWLENERRRRLLFEIVRKSLWEFYDRTGADLLRTAGVDPRSTTRFLMVQEGVVRFARDDIRYLSEGAQAVVFGGDADLRRLQELVETRACEFAAKVGDRPLLVPSPLRSFVKAPDLPLCR